VKCEIKQRNRNIYCMIPFKYKTTIVTVYTNRNPISGCSRRGLGVWGEVGKWDSKRAEGNFGPQRVYSLL
jgi:hypothetical protein